MYYDNKRYWAEVDQYRRSQLEEMICGTNFDITKRLFDFSAKQLASFFEVYEKKYGRRSMLYARRSFDEWKCSKKRISNLILRRMVQIAPRFFSDAERKEIIKKIYQNSKTQVSYSFEIILGHRDDLEKFSHFFEEVCEKPLSHDISERVKGVMSWVSDNDAKNYNQLLSALDAEMSLSISQIAKQEMQNLISNIADLDKSAVGTHKAIFPFGSIFVYVRHPSATENIIKGIKGLFS